MNNNIKWRIFLNEIRKNKHKIQNAVLQYDKNPQQIRNLMAEIGFEETPSELKKLIDLIKLALEQIDSSDSDECF